jgi:non-specific serine/threonine protein kinase
MRDAIAWSYDLLTPEEQALFQRLAVFAGGFSLEAAEAVAIGPDAAAPDPFEGVASLTDKSLLQHVPGPGGEPRLAMLETVREFALEQLAASGEEAAIRERHAAWCLALAEAASPEREMGRAEAQWYARLDAELENLRAALAWFADAGDHVRLLRLLAAPTGYWCSRPYHAEVRGWLEPSLRAAPDAPTAVRAAAHEIGVYMAGFLGDSPASITHAEEGLALTKMLDGPFAVGRARFNLGEAWYFCGDMARAAACFAESLPLLREAGATYLAAQALGELGDTRNLIGDAAGAVALLDEALDLFRQMGNSWGIAVTLGQRAHAAQLLDDRGLAAQLFAESIAAAEEIGVARIVMGAVSGLAGVTLTLGQPERAVRLLGAVEEARKASGVGRIAHAPYAERIVAEARAALSESAFTAAWEEGRALSFADAVADALQVASSAEAQSLSVRADTSRFGLTPREQDVLRLLVEGRSDREIGETLFIGTRTVQTHVANLFAKLGVNARAEAAAVAVRQGIA